MNTAALKHSLLLLLLFTGFLFSAPVFSQTTATVAGKITDKNNKPLQGVNIAVMGLPGGTASNDKGIYSLQVPSGQTIEVVFSFIGFETVKKQVTPGPGTTIEINQVMQPSSTPLPVIDIKEKDSRNNNFIRIDPKTIRYIPNPSGNFEAVLKTIGMGVVSNNELSSQYSVRGGNYDENLVYVNDVEIYRPFLIRSGQQEGLSFINSDMVSDIRFSAGGFEANYGDKLSSVLDIKYRKPSGFGGSFYASLLGAGLHLEGVSKKKKFTYLVGGRYKSSEYLFNSLETKGEYKPVFGDIQGLFTYDISKKTDVSFLGNISLNKYQIVPENRETEFGTINEALRLTIYFDGQEVDRYLTSTGALTFTHQLTDSIRLKLIASAYKSLESETFDVQGQYFIDELEKDIGSEDFGDVAFNRGIGTYIEHARNELEANVFSVEHKGYADHRKSQTQWGVRYQHERIADELSEWDYIDSAEYALPHPPDNLGGPGNPDQLVLMQEVIKTDTVIGSNRLSGYLMNDWFFGNKSRYTFNAGIRFSYWDLNKDIVFSPRASISMKPDWERNFTFRFATGLYYQPPFYREMRDLHGNINTDLKAQRSLHLIGGMDYIFLSWGREFKFTTEAYYKFLDDMVPYKIDNIRVRYFGNNNSKGYATGLDMRINGEFVQGVESWASLSLLKTEEDIIGDFYYTYYNDAGEEIIPGYTANTVIADSIRTEPGYIPRPGDQRVTFSLFFQDYLPKIPSFKMNLMLVFGSGLPFGPPGEDKYKDVLRFPFYRRVDIGFIKILIDEDHSKQYRMKLANKIKSMAIGLEVFNLLQVNNTVSYLWVTDVTGRQYAVPNYLSARTVNLRLTTYF